MSIIVPVFNEELNIRQFYQALCSSLTMSSCNFEFVFVDDGCSDRSFDIILGLRQKDERIRCVRLSRNFGSIAAYTAGLSFARGDAAVVMSCDLQDPPSTIPDLIAKWKTGDHVVWAVRAERNDPLVKRVFARLFAHVFRGIGFKDYPLSGMDFGLFDRKVINAYVSMPESSRNFVGLIMWLGFNQGFVTYKREARYAGHSKWSFGRRLKTAIDPIVSFSQLPIWFISYLGLALSCCSFAYATFLIFGRIFFGIGDTGWASLMTTVLFIGGVQMVMLGVIGEYVWRAADHARRRPNFVVMDTVGMDSIDSQPIKSSD